VEGGFAPLAGNDPGSTVGVILLLTADRVD
jgi:hypothetical protein